MVEKFANLGKPMGQGMGQQTFLLTPLALSIGTGSSGSSFALKETVVQEEGASLGRRSSDQCVVLDKMKCKNICLETRETRAKARFTQNQNVVLEPSLVPEP